MKLSKSMTMLLRTPFKSIITLILLAAVTFCLVSQTCEFWFVSRNMTRLAQFYSITGTVESSRVPYHEIGSADALITQIIDKSSTLMKYWFDAYYDMSTAEGMDALAQSMRQYGAISQKAMDDIKKYDHILATSKRYMTSGVSDAYYRMDGNEYLFDYSARLVGEGFVESTAITSSGRADASILKITLSQFSLLAGNPNWFSNKSNQQLVINLPLFQNAGGPCFIRDGNDKREGIRINRNFMTDFSSEINPGDCLIFVGRVVSQSGMNAEAPTIFIGDITDYWCDELRITTNERDDYLLKEEFEAFRLAIEITNADVHTFDIVYTDDMMGIPRFADRLITIDEGRALTDMDNETGNCVVSSQFLRVNHLSIGDTISVGLGDMLFEQNAGLGAVASVPERYKKPVNTVELTIVGSYLLKGPPYKEAESVHHTYSVNTLFVPLTLLPPSTDIQNHEIKPGEFSFVLNHPNHADDFLKNTADYMEENGLTLILGNNLSAWRKISDIFGSSLTVTLAAIGIFLMAELAVGALIVNLYISRRKHDYAMMRVLGVTGTDAGKTLLIPLLILGFAAIITGGAVSWGFTERTIEGIAAKFATVIESSVSSDLPPFVFILCILLSIASVVVPALFTLQKLRKTQPLTLLQGSQAQLSRKTVKEQSLCVSSGIDEKEGTAPSLREKELTAAISDLPRVDIMPSKGDAGFSSSSRHVLRYIMRHIRRTKVKSLLSLLVPALLFALIGQSVIMREKYSELQKSIPITGYFTDKAPTRQVYGLAEKSYLRESYYQAKLPARMGQSEIMLAVTNNFEKYSNDTEIIYSSAYGKNPFRNDVPVCVLNEEFLEAYALAVGDEIRLLTNDDYEEIGLKYLKQHTNADKNIIQNLDTDQALHILYDSIEDYLPENQIEEIAKIVAVIEAFNTAIKEAGTAFTIVGTISYDADDNRIPNLVLASAGSWYTPFTGTTAFFDEAEFTLGDNSMADVFKSDGMISARRGMQYSPDLRFTLDTSALDHVRRISGLIESLFPIVLAVSAIISGLFPLLMILQLAKDASIMRLQGTTISGVASALALERVLLIMPGVLFAAAGLIVYNDEAFIDMAGILALYGVLTMAVGAAASIAAAVGLSMRNPLRSLQLKE
ncbi:MAG: FtsX-like permease family protein [Clostridia bacterium]|nr:FtsX-like permease family protein [Clostridia bacterium]